jgi:hypothetical protein
MTAWPVRDNARAAWIFGLMALAGFLLFGLATGVVMAPHAAVIGDRLGEMTCLQVAFTTPRMMAVLGSFSPDERAAIASLLVPGDMIFAWAYGLLLAGLLGLLTLRLPPDWQRWGWILMWAPLVASGLDSLENLALYHLASIFPARGPGWLPLAAGLLASLKYLCLSIAAPAYGIAGSAKAITIDRRPGALLIYALVVLNAIAFFLRPAQQIPACF